ncbi:ScbR family autoregulator-binding transcription factor [Streptomyces sp. NPDC002446]
MTMQDRARATRHALIRSAAQTFDHHGYAQAKLSGISSGAGVSPGALHFHFDTKSAMAAAVEAEAASTLRGLARNIPRRGTSALQVLIDVTHAFAQQIRWDVVVRAGLRLNCDASHATDVNLNGMWSTCVQEIIADAANEGAVLSGVSHEDMTATVVAATIGVETLGLQNPDWLSRPSLTGLWRMLLPGLAAPALLDQLNPAGTESMINVDGGVIGPDPAPVKPVPRPRRTPSG